MSDHYDGFWHIPAEHDISNFATATIEVIIAISLGVLAIVISWIFYHRGNEEQSHYASKTSSALQSVGSMVQEEKSIRDKKRESFEKFIKNWHDTILTLSEEGKSKKEKPSIYPEELSFAIDRLERESRNANSVLTMEEQQAIDVCLIKLKKHLDVLSTNDSILDSYFTNIKSDLDTIKKQFAHLFKK